MCKVWSEIPVDCSHQSNTCHSATHGWTSFHMALFTRRLTSRVSLFWFLMNKRRSDDTPSALLCEMSQWVIQQGWTRVALNPTPPMRRDHSRDPELLIFSSLFFFCYYSHRVDTRFITSGNIVLEKMGEYFSFPSSSLLSNFPLTILGHLIHTK